MSRGVNKVIIIGNLGNDPEVRQSQAGETIVNLSVATSERWTDKNSGQPVEKTEWHRVVAFKRLAEICAEYLRKGSKVYIEGQLRTQKWQDQQGQDRYTTEIVAREMQMLDSREGQGQPQQQYQAQAQPQQQPQQQQQAQQQAQPQQQAQYQNQNQRQAPQQQAQRRAPAQQQSAPPPADFDDDIPF